MNFKEYILPYLMEFSLKSFSPGKFIQKSGAAKINPVAVVNPSRPVSHLRGFGKKKTSIVNRKH